MCGTPLCFFCVAFALTFTSGAYFVSVATQSSKANAFSYFCCMKWIGNRISYLDDQNKTTFIITPEQVGVVKALMGAWFFMWFAIGVTITWSYFVFVFSQQEKLILGVFMVFWLYYFVRVGRTFLWILYGKEYIKVDKISLTIKTSIRNYGKAK